MMGFAHPHIHDSKIKRSLEGVKMFPAESVNGL